MDPCKERSGRVLADAISIDGRKEWTCKFCSGSNVWTRWRCRRCYSNIPAGLQGKYGQAVAPKSGEWTASSSTSNGEVRRVHLQLLEGGRGSWRWRFLGILGAPCSLVHLGGAGIACFLLHVYRTRVTEVCQSLDTPCGRRSVEALSS